MALTYLSSTLSEEEYIEQRFKQAHGTGKVTQGAIRNARYYCKDVYNRELITVMADIRGEVERTNQLDTAMIFLQKLIHWMTEPHPNIRSTPTACHKEGRQIMAKDLDVIKIYMSQMRLYMKKVAGIPISAEDIRDYNFSYPPPQEKEEAEPLLLHEFKIIVDNETDPRRKMLYRIKRGAEARIGAMVQLKKKHFDTKAYFESKGEIPIKIIFPKSIMKKNNGISFTNTKYVLREDEEELLRLLANTPNEESLMFGTNSNPEQARNNEEQVWLRKVQELGFTDRYKHNNRLKKNIHSIKAMTFTAAEEAVGLTYAHAYGDHSLYTKTYLRWTEEKKIKKFRKLEEQISIYTKIVKIHDSPEIVDENNELRQIIKRMSKEKIMDTRDVPADDLKGIMTKILKDHNII